MTSRNRTFYHSQTKIPILPNELNSDSEDESYPDWFHQVMKQSIENKNVNEGQKELMKLWNLHIMKHRFVSDYQLSSACDLFTEENGDKLLEKRLHRNYMLHLTSLFDYGLISPRCLENNIKKLATMIQMPVNCTAEILKEERKAQVEQWLLRNPNHVENHSEAQQQSLQTRLPSRNLRENE